MLPKYHLAASLSVGLAVLIVTKSWLLACLPFLSGFFIDGDHLLDYWLSRPKRILDVKAWYKGEYFNKQGRAFVLLHGWEYLILWTLICSYFQWVAVGWAIGAAYFLHLVMDHMGNGDTHPFFYFLTYRIVKKFRKKDLCQSSI